MSGFDGMTCWQRIFPEFKPTRFIGYYSRCRNGGIQGLFQFDVTGDETKLLEFSTSLEEANRKIKH